LEGARSGGFFIKQVGDDNGVVGSVYDEGVVETTRKKGTWRRKIGKERKEV
jgi:hypothetical protein